MSPRPTSRPSLALLAGFGLSLLLATVPAMGQDPTLARSKTLDEKLWEAAREGDIAGIDRQLAAGADVNAGNRYGVTALSFAAKAGRLDAARRLLEVGAEVDATDTFYGVDPLGWAAQGGHLEVVELLLEHGADAAQALMMGVFTNQEDIALAAIRHGSPLAAWTRDDARRAAEAMELGAVAEALGAAEVDATIPEVDGVDPSRYAGVYGDEQLGAEVKVVDRTLWARIGEAEPVALVAVGEDAFRVRDDLSRGLTFHGRSNTIEGVFLYDGPMPANLPRGEARSAKAEAEAVDDEPPAAQAEAGSVAGTSTGALPGEPVKRGEPRPWPQFRGSGAKGLADGQGVVGSWDLDSGENIRFRVKIPGLALSSPVMWDERIFLTTAVAEGADTSLETGLHGDVDTVEDTAVHEWKVLALSARDGNLLWERTVGKAVPRTARHTKSSQANSTPATDGRHLVSVFPTAGLAVHTVEGELLWQEDLGPLNAGWFYDESFEWGFASSPILWQGKVILQVDVHGGSYIAAWDVESGERLWRTRRAGVPGWSTPTVVGEGDSFELVANGSTIRSYDPHTGNELWLLAPNSEVIIATPFEAGGLVYVSAGYPPARPIYALRPGHRGDLSLTDGEQASTALAWAKNRGGAYMPTPIAYRGLFYIGHHDGRLAVYDAATGERAYRARFSRGGTFTGSPVASDGRLYFPTEDGLLYVVAAGPQYRELAIHDFGEPLMTTPAISDGLLLIRGSEHLWGVGEVAVSSGAGEATASSP